MERYLHNTQCPKKKTHLLFSTSARILIYNYFLWNFINVIHIHVKSKVRCYNIEILFNHLSNTGLIPQLISELIRIWPIHNGIYSCKNTLI